MALVILGAAISALAFAREASASEPSPGVQAGATWRELRIGAGIDMTVGTVNPLTATLVNEFYLWTAVYSYLINAGPDFEYEPDLAVRWTQLSPSKWDIQLAQNAYFVDPRLCTPDAAGRLTSCPLSARTAQVKASDVKFTFDFVFKNAAATAYMESCIDRLKSDPVTGAPTGVVIIDDFHLTIEFEGPYAPAEYTFYCIPILPEYYWTGKSANWPAEPPIGSGPYLARPLGPGEGRVPIKLDRNPFWHGPEVQGRQVLVDTIIYSSETSSSAHVQKLLSAEIDLTLAASPFEWKIFLAGKAGIKRQLVYGTSVAQMNVNVLEDDLRALTIAPRKNGHTHPMMLFWEVRAALHIATDRQRIIDEGQLGLGLPADTLVPSDHPWHYDVGPPFSWVDSNGDGNPFDFRFPGLQNVPGVPELLEEFPEGKTDTDGDKIPDSVEVAKQLLHEGGWLYDCDTNALDTPADPALPLCKRDAAGNVDLSTKLQFTMSTFNNPPSWKADVDSFIKNAAEIGIVVVLVLENISGMNNLWYGLNYEIWHWGWVLAANLDVSSGIMSIGLCSQIFSGLSNDFGYCPRDAAGKWIYDELYNQSLTETDPVKRREITNTLQKMIYDHAAYNLPFYGGQTYAYHELRWTNFRDWNDLNAIPPDIGNPAIIGQMLEPVDNRPPQFSLAPFQGFVGRPTQFSVSAIDPEGLPLAYRWDFDSSSEPGGTGVNADGIFDNDAQATVQNPTFTYASAGVRVVTVRASEIGGEWFTVKKTTANAVFVPPGQVSPDISAVGFSPLDPTETDAGVTFAATASDPQGLDIDYRWNFGDGTTAGPFRNNPVSPVHPYAPGTYEVRLRATNTQGFFEETPTIIQVVGNVAPSVAPLEDSQAVRDLAYAYVAFASDANARDTLAYEWDFGDGTPVVAGNPVTHTYTSLGDKTLTVRVRDTPGGHVSTQTATVTVIIPTNHGPRFNEPLSATPPAPYTTQEVNLKANVSDPEGNALHWEWDFNGGGADLVYDTGVTVPNQPIVRTETFRFETAGTVKPSLRVTDIPPAGTSHSVSGDITLTVTLNRPPVVLAIVVSPGTAVNTLQEVTFSVTSSDQDGNVCDYTWDFGDGVSVLGTTSLACSGGGLSPQRHTYTRAGTFIVSVTVDDRRGGRDSSGVLMDVIVPQTIAVVASGQWTQLYETQTMDATFEASVAGSPVSGALVNAGVSAGGSLAPTSCTTDAAGRCKVTASADAGSLGSRLTVTATASKAPFSDGTAGFVFDVVAARTMAITQISSNRNEMMSFETATITFRLESAGLGVGDGLITPSTRFGGSFGPVTELGGGSYAFGWTAPARTTQGFARIDVRAKVGGYLDDTDLVTILVDPNKTNPTDPTQLFLLTSLSASSVRAGGTVLVTVFAFTFEGFVVSGGTMTASLRGVGTLTVVRDELNGVYRFTYVAPASVASATNVLITISADKFGYAIATTRIGITVLP